MPADFSLIGVAAQHWAEECHPPLTSADVPAGELGAHAVSLLIERIANPAALPKHLLLCPPISLQGERRARPGPQHRGVLARPCPVSRASRNFRVPLSGRD